jgi:hypothetical protein
VVLANLGSESETCVGSRVYLVGASISLDKNFYRLPFTPAPLSGSPYRSFKLFFHMMEFRLSWSLSQSFVSHNGILAITEPLHKLSRTFSRGGIHKTHDLGEDSFHIYHKEYLHRIRLVKNLASLFRAPFARKRVRSFLF